MQLKAQNYFNRLDTFSLAFLQVRESNFGYFASGGNYHDSGTVAVFLHKLDSIGQNTIVDTLTENGVVSSNSCMEISSSGQYFLSIGINNIPPYDASSFDVLTSRFNDNLDSTWSINLGGGAQELPTDVKLVNGQIYWLSSTLSYGAGSSDLYLVKTDTLGNVIWEHTYGSANAELAKSIRATQDGNILLTGRKRYVDPEWNIYLAKIDTAGNVIWEKDYGHNIYDFGGDLTALSDHTFLVYHNEDDGSLGTVSTGHIDKLDGNGDIIWSKTYPYIDYTAFAWSNAIENADGTLMVEQSARNAQGKMISRLLKLEPAGDTLWTKEYYTNEDHSQYIYDMTPTSDGGYLMGGWALEPDTNIQRAWLIKTDCNGAEDSMYTTGAPCQQYDCTQYPIDAYFTASETVVDLAFGGQVTFTNSSSNTTSRVWSFGDGTMDYTDAQLTHTFTDTGWYDVSLIVFHGMCSDTMTVPIHVINSVGLAAYSNIGYGMKAYPNPAKEQFTLSFEHIPQNGSCIIYNMVGQENQQITLQNGVKKYTVYNLPRGVYLVELRDEFGSREVLKVVMQ
ncbi:MAG: T9SS type A sorting domain-containing protein [Crocinitomicaceae bacterium]|nr:T9SS type A sorting domain-containing protein [Crocinitomicaceae bacterium]